MKRRPRLLEICRFCLAGCLAITTCALVSGCNTPQHGTFEQLHKGMDQPAVLALVGEPSSRYPAQLNKSGAIDVPARWQYGDNLSSLASSAMFQDQPPSERVWVIFFDGSGNVSEWQKPHWEQ